MTDTQVVKRAKYKSAIKDPGLHGTLIMTRERFVFMPNDQSESSVKLNVEFRHITGHKSSKKGINKEGINKPALLNLTAQDQGNYLFEFENYADRDQCRDFVGQASLHSRCSDNF